MKLFRIAGFCLMSLLPGLTQAEESTSNSDSPQLPDLPEVNRPSEATSPEMNLDRSTPATPDLPETRRPNRPTQEQLEQAKKEKNWLLEGLKEREAQAEAARQEKESNRNSIIDQVLNKNREQMGIKDPDADQNAETKPEDANNTFQPALSTSAYEPLPQIEGSDSLAEAQSKLESSKDLQKKTWKAVDEKTGVPNVFFNPRTGTFESQPVDYSAKNNTMEVEWQRQQRQQREQNQFASRGSSDPVEEKVRAFESQLIEQAKAQNKLPEDFTQNNSREAMTFNPGRLDSGNGNSPYLFANRSDGNQGAGAGNMETPFQRDQPSFTAQQGNDVALAKLRMIEEERQKRFENEQQPTIMEIHSPRPTRTLEINPRFD